MAEIDSLEIKIQSDEENASKKLDILIGKLDLVAKGISAIGNSQGFKNLFSQAQSISKSMSSVGTGFKSSMQSTEQQTQKVAKTLADMEKQYANLGKGFTLKGSTEFIQKNIESLTNQLAKVTLAKERFETSGRTDSSGYERSIAKVMELKNQIESLTSQLNSMNKMRAVADIKIIGGEQAKTTIEEFKSRYFELLEITKAGGRDTEAGKMLPLSEVQFELNQLREMYPEAASLISAFEGLNEKLNQMQAGTTWQQFGNIDLSKFESANQSVKKLGDEVEKLGGKEKTAEKNTSSLGNSFNKLQDNSVNLSKSINSLGKNINKTFSKMKSFTRQILSAAGIMGGLYGAIRAAVSSVDIASDLTEVQNVVDVTFGNFKDKIESLADVSIPQFGMSELTAKQIASRFQAMGTAMGFAQDKMADMSADITKLSADMASFYNVAQEDVSKSLESIFTGTTRPLRQYGLDLTQAALQEWALKQGIDANIQSMSQAEKTMLRYQYVMAHTTAAQGDFQRTINSWHNQITILKQNFKELGGVIGGSLINAFKPFIRALNEAMSHIIAFAKTVSNALGKIFGWKYETGGGVATDLGDGAGYADDIAGGMDKAAKAGKKLRDYVLGIDEFNIIAPEEQDGGTGAGGAGTGGVGDYGYKDAVGAWKKTESMFESDIDSLFKLGRYISDAISRESISAMSSPLFWRVKKTAGFEPMPP